MQILLCCNKPPYPTVDGGTLATAAMLDDMVALGARITCLVMDTPKHPFREEAIPGRLKEKVRFRAIALDNRPKALSAMVALLTGNSYILDRFRTTDFSDVLEEELEDSTFDLVQLEGLYLLPYVPLIRAVSGAPIIYRAHNIEHDIWRHSAREVNGTLKRWYLNKEARKLRRKEVDLSSQVAGTLAIAHTDAEVLRQWHPDIPVETVSFGVDVSGAPPQLPCDSGSRPVVFHLGAMDWLPNVEGVHWLIDDIWPRVRQAIPEAELHLAGRGMPEDIMTANLPGVQVEGTVPDAAAYLASRDILAVPLRSGSGLRIKILEAMALGRAVVATPQGMQGLNIQHGEQALVAEDAEAFANALVQLINSPDMVQQLGTSAREWVGKYHSKTGSRKALRSFYRKFVAI